jgi:probable H4MPT-linked C1 transfer pathway protein
MPPTVLGLDVGGANLKVANGAGFAIQTPFALWKQPDRLPNALRRLINDAPPFDHIAVTMTGELCDCYETKRIGVNAILDAVEAAVEGTAPISVWTTDGRFVSVPEARRGPLKAAASNWLATATYVGRLVPDGAAILVDIGSTTTDLIPLLDGQPCPAGRTDTERLKSREMVYTGVRRTPVCAFLGRDGMAEFFATIHDVNLILGRIREDPSDCDTADGRPAMKTCAHARLARMLGGDAETTDLNETTALAHRVAQAQVDWIRSALADVSARLPRAPRVVTAGSGEFLARMALEAPAMSLAEYLEPHVSVAAAAFAVAVLAAEHVADAGLLP